MRYGKDVEFYDWIWEHVHIENPEMIDYLMLATRHGGRPSLDEQLRITHPVCMADERMVTSSFYRVVMFDTYDPSDRRNTSDKYRLMGKCGTSTVHALLKLDHHEPNRQARIKFSPVEFGLDRPKLPYKDIELQEFLCLARFILLLPDVTFTYGDIVIEMNSLAHRTSFGEHAPLRAQHFLNMFLRFGVVSHNAVDGNYKVKMIPQEFENIFGIDLANPDHRKPKDIGREFQAAFGGQNGGLLET